MVTKERYEQIKSKCDEKGYKLLTPREEIINNQSYITYICPIHGEYTTRVTSLLQNKSCFKCSRRMAGLNRWKHSTKERHDKNYNKVLKICEENGYKLITPYEAEFKIVSYIEYECPKHGIKRMKIGNLYNGKRCPDCNLEKARERYQLSKEEIIEKAKSVGSDILNPEDYINNSVKNLVAICPRCGAKFTTSLKHLVQHGGQHCDDCYRKESVGELKVRQYLELNSYHFIQEKWFADCRDQKPLPFDFYLPEKNCCIEFDGKQHYCDNHYFKRDNTMNHDKIKTEYCNSNNIKLIRIPYWKMNNIEKILSKELV